MPLIVIRTEASAREARLRLNRANHHLARVLPALLAAAFLPGCEAESRGDLVSEAPRPPELREWVPDPAARPEAPPDTLLVADGLRSRFEGWSPDTRIHAGAHPIHSAELLYSLFEEREFDPIWLDGPRLTPEGERLTSILAYAHVDGLRPSDYHLPEIDSVAALLGAGGEDELRHRVDLDLLLTDAFLLFGTHLARGRLSPTTLEPTWRVDLEALDMVGILKRALDEEDVDAAIAGLRPARAEYRRMREGLATLRALAAQGGWGSVPPGERLEEGDRNVRVVALRSRLQATGELGGRSSPSGDPLVGDPPGGDASGEDASASDPEIFDAAVTRAVRVFQMRHGLEVDGTVGPATLGAINVPVEERIRQIELNMERQRWLPADLGDRHLIVNIAGFTLDLWEEGERVRHHRVIVGRDYRQTPVFSATITYLVFAPYWHIPPGIAANDMLPRIRENPGYVAEQRMVLFDAVTNQRVDPHSVNWTGMRGTEFNRRFRLRQEPGPENALGRVKFMFPNEHSVYLHDTPAQALFERAVRDFSSGCIRVEDPLELAEHLLRADPSWSRTRMEEVIAGGRERNVMLPHPWQIHMQYWTSWVDEEGTIHFRDDIYSRDGRVLAALGRPHSPG